MKYLKRLKSRHWAWIHFKVATGVLWPLYMILTPPELLAGVVSPAIMTLCMVVSIIGTLASVVGYFFSQQLGKLGVIGVSIELSGLTLAVIGPGAYLLTRVYMLFLPEYGGLSSGLLFAYALCAVYLYRFIILIPRFRFEAQDPSKE